MSKIMHIVSLVEWERAKTIGLYTAPSLRNDGFIHCSLPQQIPPVANYNFRGQEGLVLLEIDMSKLKEAVKFEDLYGEGKEYPHVYGPINIESVIRVIPFPPEADGTFKLPPEIEI